MKIHSKLPELMAAKNPKLTQRQVAKATKLGRTTINKLYNGQPMTGIVSLETIEAICTYFDCDVGDLLTVKP